MPLRISCFGFFQEQLHFIDDYLAFYCINDEQLDSVGYKVDCSYFVSFSSKWWNKKCNITLLEPNVTTPNLKISLAKNEIKATWKSIHLLNGIATNSRSVPEYLLYLYWKQDEKVSIVLHQCVVIHTLIDLAYVRVHNHIIYDPYNVLYTQTWCFMGTLKNCRLLFVE